jgi:hypothetical protein
VHPSRPQSRSPTVRSTCKPPAPGRSAHCLARCLSVRGDLTSRVTVVWAFVARPAPSRSSAVKLFTGSRPALLGRPSFYMRVARACPLPPSSGEWRCLVSGYPSVFARRIYSHTAVVRLSVFTRLSVRPTNRNSYSTPTCIRSFCLARGRFAAGTSRPSRVGS